MSEGRAGNRRVDHLRVDRRKALGFVAPLAQELPLLGIAQVRQVDFVELQVAAAGLRERLDGAAVSESEIAIELIHVRVDLRAHGAAAAAEMKNARRGNRHLCGRASVVAQKAEMVQHRVRGEAHLADDPQTFGLGFDPALKGNPVIGAKRFHAVELFQEIEVPHGAAELAVGGAEQADFGLPRDDVLDRGIFGGGEFGGGDLAALASRSRLFESRGPQQTAHVVGAKRRSWFGSWFLSGQAGTEEAPHVSQAEFGAALGQRGSAGAAYADVVAREKQAAVLHQPGEKFAHGGDALRSICHRSSESIHRVMPVTPESPYPASLYL